MNTSTTTRSVFDCDNLFAWCIASHDTAQRTPEQRARMLAALGIQGLAWGNRMAGAVDLPRFDAEMQALQTQGIRLVARYVPAQPAMEEWTLILEAMKRWNCDAQLWISEGNRAVAPTEHAARIMHEANRIGPLAQEAARYGLKMAMYNHTGWFGHPLNQVAIIHELRSRGIDNVFLVHGQHWGHVILDDFEQVFMQIKPFLVGLTLCGMTRDGDKIGKQFLPVGAGDEDARLFRFIDNSGWRGPVGIINHTDNDAEARLRDHLDGLAWLAKAVRGESAGPLPAFRTWSPHS